MPTNKISTDQGPFLKLVPLKPDRMTPFTRKSWGDRGNSMPTRAWYNKNRIRYSLFNGTDLVGGIHRWSMPIFQALNHELRISDYHPLPGQCWGGAYRTIRGSTKPSTHAFLVAADFNSRANPMSTRFHTDFPLAVITRIMAVHSVRSGHPAWLPGIRWTRRPDPMHFQIQISPDETLDGIRCSDGAEFRHEDDLAHQTVATALTLGIYSMGSKAAQVSEIQRLLIKVGALPAGADDGAFGHQTEEAVKRWQTHLGVRDDGVWGPDTERRTRLLLYTSEASTVTPRPVHAVDPQAAEEAVRRAYDAELGRGPDTYGLARWVPALTAGEATEAELRAILRTVPEAREYQLGLSAAATKEIEEAVVASYVERYRRKPGGKDLTIGITKVTNTLAETWESS